MLTAYLRINPGNPFHARLLVSPHEEGRTAVRPDGHDAWFQRLGGIVVGSPVLL